MAYRRIAPSIMREAGAQGDITESLYDAKGFISQAETEVKKAGKYGVAGRKAKYTGKYLKLLDIQKQLSEKDQANYNQSMALIEMMTGWRMDGSSWDEILGTKGLSLGNSLGSDWKVS